MVEHSHAGKIGVYISSRPAIEEGEIRGNSCAAQHRHQQRCLILAIAVLAFQGLGWKLWDKAGLAKLHTGVTDVLVQGSHNSADNVVSASISCVDFPHRLLNVRGTQ